MTPIQVNIQSSDIHEEDQFYFLPEDDSEKVSGNGNKKPGKTFYNPQTNNQNWQATPLTQTLKWRTYHWYVTTYKTRKVNKGAKSTMIRILHAASDHIRTRTTSSGTSNLNAERAL